MSKIKITVPATSANLGPGFDCVGIALSLYNEFIFESSTSYKFINVKEEYANDNNLIVKSARYTYDYYHIKEVPFSIYINEEVPISRGLGSSATCIVAGIMSANYFANLNLNKDEVLYLATLIEGHPDNVNPAIFGGLVTSSIIKMEHECDKIIHIKHDVNNEHVFTIVYPNFEVRTSDARRVLPQEISLQDAVHNMSYLVNAISLFNTSNYEDLFYLLDDKLHEPFRFTLIHESEKFKALSVKYKIPFCISGSGPTLLFISKESISNLIKELKLNYKWNIKEVRIDNTGVIVEEII